MAEEQKTVEVPLETKPETTPAPAVETEVPAAETKPAEEPLAVAAEPAAPVAEDKAAEEAKPAETPAEEAPKAEEKKEEEAKPIEEGHLAHKAQGLSFPKNLIPSKEFFFFGSDVVEPKTLAHYQKTEKSADTARSNIAWASQTGKGLLFVGDKKAPSSVISLVDATEPEVDGSHKFHFTSKGNKHTFKAANTAERDNWVSQLKLKIAEAKEISASVTESETYKQTLESFSPAKKEEVKEEAPKTEEAAPATPAAVAEETPKEEEERKKEEVRSEEPKRRSASRKRTSFFGFGKKEEKKDEVKDENKPVEEEAVAAETPAAETAVETPALEVETPKIEEPATEAAPATEEAKPAEEKPVESPKPLGAKRNSFFGSVFSKKEKKTPELKATEPAEAVKEGEATEAAPVIPPVEATTPLAVDVSNPTNVPAENSEAVAATNGEVKKDTKEKRKSSLPFAFGKRDKSPAPADGEDRNKSPFSKLRATIKGKNKADKPAEEAAKEEAVKEEEEPAKDEVKAEEAKTELAKEEPAKPAETEEEKPENVPSTTPAVTAAA